MLVEINLLPQKERKKFAFFMVLAGFLALFLLTGAYYFFQINTMKKNIEGVDREITMTQKLREKEEAKNQSVESSSSVTQLKSAIEWANTYPIHTIPVMRHLTSLLPERGFIQSFGYTEAGTVTLSVQFDSPREAASFLNNLHESKWISDAKLSSLNPAAQAEASSTGSTTGQTAATNQNTGTVNTGTASDGQTQAGTAANTGVQQDTTNTATGTTTQTDASSSAAPAASTSNNTATTQTGTVSNAITNLYLPRYTGQFEITFNKDVIKQENIAGKTDEKGVSGS